LGYHPDLGEAARDHPVGEPPPVSSRHTPGRPLAPYKSRGTTRDDLVRNAMGKLDKKAMRAPYWHDERTIAG
jgi:long-chain acyl-CoA synthetase